MSKIITESILEVIHETAQSLHKAGVMDTETLREFDILCEPVLKQETPYATDPAN